MASVTGNGANIIDIPALGVKLASIIVLVKHCDTRLLDKQTDEPHVWTRAGDVYYCEGDHKRYRKDTPV